MQHGLTATLLDDSTERGSSNLRQGCDTEAQPVTTPDTAWPPRLAAYSCSNQSPRSSASTSSQMTRATGPRTSNPSSILDDSPPVVKLADPISVVARSATMTFACVVVADPPGLQPCEGIGSARRWPATIEKGGEWALERSPITVIPTPRADAARSSASKSAWFIANPRTSSSRFADLSRSLSASRVVAHASAQEGSCDEFHPVRTAGSIRNCELNRADRL